MTNGVACPEPLLLSRFLDHELEDLDESRISHHLARCPDCRAHVDLMRRTDGLARTQVPVSHSWLSSPELASACPPLEKVTAYMQELLATSESQHLEQHIQSCERCFQEAKEAARVMVFLASARTPPVPVSLQARVATQWDVAANQGFLLSLPRLVIQMTEQGLRLIESYLALPLLDVQEVPTSLSAVRRGERSSALTLRLQAVEAEIDVFAIPEDDGVALSLTLLSPQRTALADHRVFIRQQGRAIFSAQTDYRGELHVPRLEPGEYEVSCHEIDTTFRLELRS